MNKKFPPTRFPQSIRVALVTCLLLLPAVNSRALAPKLPVPTDRAPNLMQSEPIRIENVIHIVGLDDRPGGTGNLVFDDNTMTLDVHGHPTEIPLHSILAFSIVHGNKALISGTKGKIADAMPYGVGFAISMTRKPADTLTLFYRDSNYAIHGCVLVLPSGAGERVISTLANVRLSPTDYPKIVALIHSEAKYESGLQMVQTSRLTKPSVVVSLPSESADGIPSAFPAAVYENVIEQLTQSGLFAHVWHANDSHRTPDALVLNLDIEGWKEGSARGRAFGPFTGATEIKSSITLVGASGRTVFQGEVNGSKRTNGENLEVTNILAKHVRKVLGKASVLKAYTQKAK